MRIIDKFPSMNKEGYQNKTKIRKACKRIYSSKSIQRDKRREKKETIGKERKSEPKQEIISKEWKQP